MVDPAKTLIGEVERELAGLPGAALNPAAAPDAVSRLAAAFGRVPPPGFAELVGLHDGGLLAPDIRLLAVDEAVRRYREMTGPDGRGGAWPAGPWASGVWPVMEKRGRFFALDADGAEDPEGEWPVVEVGPRGLDRVGSSLLRFVHVLLAELAAGTPEGPEAELALARERCRRDPGLADHWLDLIEVAEEAGRGREELDALLGSALRAAAPPTPALMVEVGLRALRGADWAAAARSFEDAITLEPLTGRDDDARLDAAALLQARARETGDAALLAAGRRVLGDAAPATAAYWRIEAVFALAVEGAPRGGVARAPSDVALRVVEALVPDDADVAKLRARTPAMLPGLQLLRSARDALDAGRPEQAARDARGALANREVAELGLAHALLAEALNALRDRGAIAAAERATQLNPVLVEGWRELGDACLDADDLRAAERALRKVIEVDPTYGLGFAKLAQVLLEEERTVEALETINVAQEKGGDPFFLSAIRGDILAEMERHGEAAEAYDEALRLEPEDHWALHQAAVEHAHAGHPSRATELFEAAIRHDHEGCYQTFVDFGDHMRRVGRIGDAVRLYRRAVEAVPTDPEWRQMLRDAERELRAAPN